MGKRQERESEEKKFENSAAAPRAASSGSRDKRFVPTLYVRLACYRLGEILFLSVYPMSSLPSHRSGCIAALPKLALSLLLLILADIDCNQRAANPRRAIPHPRSTQLPKADRRCTILLSCAWIVHSALISPTALHRPKHGLWSSRRCNRSPDHALASAAHEISSTCTCCMRSSVHALFSKSLQREERLVTCAPPLAADRRSNHEPMSALSRPLRQVNHARLLTDRKGCYNGRRRERDERYTPERKGTNVHAKPRVDPVHPFARLATHRSTNPLLTPLPLLFVRSLTRSWTRSTHPPASG